MGKNNVQTSSIPLLRPVTIWDVRTGEEVSSEVFEADVAALVGFVQREVQTAFEANPVKVIADAGNLSGSANSYGRKLGYKSSALDLPKEVLAKSRINELFRHKLMSEVASYAKNPNPLKQYPSFPLKVNLGAVDKQMVTLAESEGMLTLVWKCWSREFLLEFKTPSYVLKREIVKYSLPTVEFEKGRFGFRFTTQSLIPTLPKSQLRAGLDLGRVEPYTVAVINHKDKLVAQYTTGGRLKQLAHKRENILGHKRNILAKIDQYEKLGLDSEVLILEKTRLTTKATLLGKVVAQELGSELAHKLKKHSLNTLNVENLTWVTGTNYGSKWNHSKQQDTIAHALLANGSRVKKVSPRNSSQTCHSCGSTLTHSDRKAHCSTCQTQLDRDFNAALNLAKLSHLNKRYPSLSHRLVGDICSPIGQDIDTSHNSLISPNYKDSN